MCFDTGIVKPEVDSFVLRAAFSTLTNVNFSTSAFVDYINTARDLTSAMKEEVTKTSHEIPAWCVHLFFGYNIATGSECCLTHVHYSPQRLSHEIWAAKV